MDDVAALRRQLGVHGYEVPTEVLVALDADPKAWSDQGSCAVQIMLDDIWSSTNNKDTRAALAACGSCPVLAQCYAETRRQDQRFDINGTQGGMTEYQRRAARRGGNPGPLKSYHNPRVLVKIPAQRQPVADSAERQCECGVSFPPIKNFRRCEACRAVARAAAATRAAARLAQLARQ